MTRVVLMIVAGLAFAAFVELVIVRPAVRAAKARRALRDADGSPEVHASGGTSAGTAGRAAARAAGMAAVAAVGAVAASQAGTAQRRSRQLGPAPRRPVGAGRRDLDAGRVVGVALGHLAAQALDYVDGGSPAPAGTPAGHRPGTNARVPAGVVPPGGGAAPRPDATEPPAPPVPVVADPLTAAATKAAPSLSGTDHGRAIAVTLRRLAGYARGYEGRTFADGTPVTDAAGAVVIRTQQLFERLARREDAQQARLAEGRYADLLGKVAKIVSPTYLGDILDHPELWPDPQERVEQVAATLRDVVAQIIENIRQVNTSSDLDFQVAMTSLSAITHDDEFNHLYVRTS